jgi:hypothetical protein
MYYFPVAGEEVAQPDKEAAVMGKRAMWALGFGVAATAGLLLDMKNKEISGFTPIGLGVLTAVGVWFRP